MLRCKPLHHRQELPELDWVIVTDKAIPPISLLGSGRVRPMNESPVPLCQTCLGYHPRRACLRPPRCRKCGRGGHTTETCNRPEQCANCLGPHASGTSFCPARPKRNQEGVLQLPTASNQKAIRDLGERNFRKRQEKTNTQTETPQTPTLEPAQSSPSLPPLDNPKKRKITDAAVKLRAL